ncbi:AzlC family ABC transporter permease [Mammaliicoccus sp. Dog046]|uniref:AzlC family ABC transporter permease n=1 Tax=Mammaliicoccus sp. Dog046 TaxID=3034233 RepID=UPI002B258119|nr:AzlC family ABC transporter permease [Mammaliicoccus sp. Dog046]WQK86666.1 AzlC family ABC transporter permease [Mammaliicoccus sp. Dog046]
MFLLGVKDCLPTMLGYFSVALAFGIVGMSSGLSILEITLLSIFVYAGAAQFIICALVAIHSPISAIFLTIFFVNSRMFLQSLTLFPPFKNNSLISNIGIGSLVTDESFGVAVTKYAKDKKLDPMWMHGLNISAYLMWIIVSLIGAWIGNMIPNPEMFGLDYALSAMFIFLLIAQFELIRKDKVMYYLYLIVLTVICMLLFTIFMPTYISILLSTIVASIIGVVFDK